MHHVEMVRRENSICPEMEKMLRAVSERCLFLHPRNHGRSLECRPLPPRLLNDLAALQNSELFAFRDRCQAGRPGSMVLD